MDGQRPASNENELFSLLNQSTRLGSVAATVVGDERTAITGRFPLGVAEVKQWEVTGVRSSGQNKG